MASAEELEAYHSQLFENISPDLAEFPIISQVGVEMAFDIIHNVLKISTGAATVFETYNASKRIKAAYRDLNANKSRQIIQRKSDAHYLTGDTGGKVRNHRTNEREE